MALLSRDATLNELRRDRISVAMEQFSQSTEMDDDYLWQAVLAAEADASRRLRVRLVPTKVFAGDPTTEEVDALSGAPYVVEPAYDHNPGEMVLGTQWGYLVTRQAPVIGVQSIEFVFPTGGGYQVPAAWIKVDRDVGHIRIVPQGASYMTPVSAFVLSMQRGVPHMIKVRYTAGLTDAVNNYPDLVDLIKKMAILRIIDDTFPAGSGSISVDGLSQSMSVDVQKYQNRVDNMLAALQDSIHGVRCMVF